MAKTSVIYGVSLVLHGVLAIAVLRVREPKRREVVAISVSDAKKKPPEPAKAVEPIKPIEPKTEAPQKTKPRAAPKTENTPPPPSDASPKPQSAAIAGLPDLGLSMGNGPGGIAIPQGNSVAAAAPTQAPAAAAAPKVLAPRPDDCTEAVAKPKVKSTSQPSPTSAAREAGVEGKVRIEVSVGPDGHVTSARIVSGLGYGLDEASLEAARRAIFEPATRCGKAVAGTVVMAFRFQSQ